MRLVFLGPPGAGKGTQAKQLVDDLSVPHISTGELLREAMEQGTEVGNQARQYVDAGQLVPDSVMLDLMAERLAEDDCRRGFVLDGFPRTQRQAEGLDARLAETDQSLDAVLYLRVSDEHVVARLSGRRLCRQCGASYHVEHVPPRRAGVCDRCGGPLEQREDDKPETIRNRLRVYHEQTAPLIEYYTQRGLLHEVEGDGSVSEIAARIRGAVDALSS